MLRSGALSLHNEAVAQAILLWRSLKVSLIVPCFAANTSLKSV